MFLQYLQYCHSNKTQPLDGSHQFAQCFYFIWFLWWLCETEVLSIKILPKQVLIACSLWEIWGGEGGIYWKPERFLGSQGRVDWNEWLVTRSRSWEWRRWRKRPFSVSQGLSGWSTNPDSRQALGLSPRTLLLCGVKCFRHMCVLLHCSPPSLVVFAPNLRHRECIW